MLTINHRPCQAASHHIGSSTQISLSGFPSLGRAEPVSARLDPEHHQAGAWCPPGPLAHLPQPANLCPRSAATMPEDLARYATGCLALSYNSQTACGRHRPERSHARATNGLLRARPHGSRAGIGFGRGPLDVTLASQDIGSKRRLRGFYK